MFAEDDNGSLAPGTRDMAASMDARRRDRAQLVEILRLRGRSLPPSDRTLMEAVYTRGERVSGLARLMGCNARTLRVRVRRVSRRLLSAPFVFVARRSESWAPMRRAVARACFVEGRSLREAANQLGLTQAAVRRHRDAVLAMLESEARK